MALLKTLLAPILLATAATVLSLLGAELLLRIVFPSNGVTRIPTQYLTESRIGFTPNAEWTVVEPEFTEKVNINSLGYRDIEVDPARPTIVFLGDSQTFGTGLNFGERVSDIVRAELPSRCASFPLQVLNVAMPGASTFDELAFLQDIRSKGVKVQAVLLGVVTNDHLPNKKQTELKEKLGKDLARKKEWSLSKFLRELRNGSRLISFTTQRLSKIAWFNSIYAKYKLDLGLGEFQSLRNIYANEEIAADKISYTTQLIKQIATIAPTSVVVIPDKYRYVSSLQGAAYEELVKGLQPGETIDFNRESRIMRESLSETSIEYFDPIDTFARHAQPDTLSYPINGHLSPLGARLLAEEILRSSSVLQAACGNAKNS